MIDWKIWAFVVFLLIGTAASATVRISPTDPHVRYIQIINGIAEMQLTRIILVIPPAIISYSANLKVS
jgi:hypothetical protein